MNNLEQTPQSCQTDVMAMLPMHGTHKTFGRIEILGVRVKSTTSNNLMYMTIIDGDILWVYDYETELDFTKQDYDKKLLMDFTPKIYEWIMKPPFNLEHAQHGLACEKFGDVRTDFLKKRSLGNQPSRLGAGIRWVAVTDALPKIASEDYLVVKNGEVSISLFRGDWNEFQCDLNDFQKVTHWSECPKPP